jgi:hypothetical protein
MQVKHIGSVLIHEQLPKWMDRISVYIVNAPHKVKLIQLDYISFGGNSGQHLFSPSPAHVSASFKQMHC